MAAVSRQPFAPLNEGRLSGLTSLKNRQNALSTKRKAAEVDPLDDAENVDPSMFSKRAKSSHSNIMKPSQYVLKKASTPVISLGKSILGNASTQPRHILQAKSQQIRLNTRIATPTTLTAPAGRSPTRGSKKGGILPKRRIQRVDPPSFGGVSAPFSLDAALKGTIPSYSGDLGETKSTKSTTTKPESFTPSTMKSDWFFDIHEDTPEQEMTNLLQHSTCVLDISSDEETEKRETRECAEGRDKENVPPTDDVSQTQSARTPSTRGANSNAGSDADDMIVEKNRGPLHEMVSQDFWPEGTDDEDFFVVPGDEDDAAATVAGPEVLGDKTGDSEEKQHSDIPQIFVDNFEDDEADEADTSSCSDSDDVDSVDGIMGVHDGPVKAAVLEPIEGTGESFELWESESAKDQLSVPSSPAREGVLGEVDIAEC
ncbi:hypothetical protein GE21DRAFT_6885 [Neurospora crassa]|uniref:Thymidylate kinase n=2 Tax=Neurospora crassa TaxID=5141 RepID=Q1K690_NEUCR|nr:hypothetical protein NCU07771 [Neurospora crassa OR74A]EAA29456.1 hypothetical protein NCU07771 [Neurospora crassa OR74A]KHE85044.1 hypothetical protein GE21DRAFT_6885 [Neurospora crassa]CAD11786.1 hypothetical protein [Neurospora crassa]|eukprot:XP_958692.1 hypothetical protein NCU07771 [Neurospora crassa OR74A]